MFQRTSPRVSSLVADKIIRGCTQLRLAETEVQETWVSLSNSHHDKGAKNYTLDLEVLPEQVGQAGAGQATLHNARPGGAVQGGEVRGARERYLIISEQSIKPSSIPAKLRITTPINNCLITKVIYNLGWLWEHLHRKMFHVGQVDRLEPLIRTPEISLWF